MQESTQTNAVGVNPLEGFDFEKHGTDEGHFRALADLSFIERGENVLILGGIGSGKTTLANILLKQATDSGLTAMYVDSPSCYYPRLPVRYLECDLLLMDEAHIWADVAPRAMLALLLKRHELGKSNVLLCVSSNWQRLLSQQAVATPRTDANREDWLLAGLVEYCACSAALSWAIARQWSPAVMLHLLGFGNRITLQEFNQLEPYLLRLNRLPFWHIIQTGEKSWRQIR
jgi:hypothetical protein